MPIEASPTEQMVTTPPTSPVNTPTCQECQTAKRLFDGKVCLGCYGLTIVKKAAWPDGTPTWFTCPQCNKEWSKLKSSGICFDCDAAKFEKLAKAKLAEERFKKIFGSINAMNYYTFDRFKQTSENAGAFRTMRSFDCKRDNVFLHGPTGVGKTHLAYSAAKMYCMNGAHVVISTPLRLVDSFRTRNDMEKEDRYREFTEADVLLIDELGVSKNTDFALEVLCEILNRRTLQLRNGLIVTSNLSLEQLSKKNNDDRLCSRLAGMCNVIWMNGEDFRTGIKKSEVI